jgi:hypothetical protein
MIAHSDLFGVESPEMRKGATLSDCLTYRWTLTRDWAEGERVCWVMLNPSDANHEIDDPTIRRCIHFTRSWGYAGFTVVNLYPYRSPNPPKCKAWATDSALAEVVESVLRQNAEIVAEQTGSVGMVIAAWGNNPWDESLLAATIGSILTNRPEIYCLGTTQGGSPKHPMARGKHRVPDDQQPVLWQARS